MSGHNALTDLLESEYSMIDPGNGKAIVPDRQHAMVHFKTTAAETRTVPAPTKEGLRLTLAMQVDGGDCVVTASAAVNQAGNTILTFADAGDVCTLLSIALGSSYAWRIVENDGVALS